MKVFHDEPIDSLKTQVNVWKLKYRNEELVVFKTKLASSDSANGCKLKFYGVIDMILRGYIRRQNVFVIG